MALSSSGEMPSSENNLVVMDLLRPKVNVTNNGGLGRTIFGMKFNAKARRRRSFFHRMNRMGGNILFGIRCEMKTPSTGDGRDQNGVEGYGSSLESRLA
jgi:hypothetical protein